MSPWWPPMALSTSSDFSPYLRANSMPIAGCPPSISWSIALPMSCRKPHRRAMSPVEAELVGDDLAEVRHLDRVPQHVLAVARAEVQLAHRLDDLRVQAADVRLDHRVVAELDDPLAPCPCGPVSTTSSMREGWTRPSATSFCSDSAGDRPPDRVEAGDRDHARACRRRGCPRRSPARGPGCCALRGR